MTENGSAYRVSRQLDYARLALFATFLGVMFYPVAVSRVIDIDAVRDLIESSGRSRRWFEWWPRLLHARQRAGELTLSACPAGQGTRARSGNRPSEPVPAAWHAVSGRCLAPCDCWIRRRCFGLHLT
ncbi:hypothetical protein [Nocardia sp. NPDC052316]|uniref:hypothetical protein n=1 Tax=Nocardia sp. NPDC052316 TaxID=3364329 RepID=UPI0037C91735